MTKSRVLQIMFTASVLALPVSWHVLNGGYNPIFRLMAFYVGVISSLGFVVTLGWWAASISEKTGKWFGGLAD